MVRLATLVAALLFLAPDASAQGQASGISFDPSTSTLTCDDLQECLEEIDSRGLLTPAKLDFDGDGEYEIAELWDADGDGSIYVACTAKDAPDPACKVAGERIYRDFADDVNCAVHGCGAGPKMERNGILRLRNAVYVNFPCWDAGAAIDGAGPDNDPLAAATNDSLHDETGDPAAGDCPVVETCILPTVSLLDWQGTIEGQGRDLTRRDTSLGLRRDLGGTYIVDDRGPDHSGTDDNVWFGFGSGGLRGIGAGFAAGDQCGQQGPGAWTGDGLGLFSASGAQSVDTMGGALCVVDTGSWTASLVAGDLVTARIYDSAGNQRMWAELRVRTDGGAYASCNGGAGVAIPIGGAPAFATAAWNPSIYLDFANGAPVAQPRREYRNGNATLRGFTIEPQDYWNESGGDCANADPKWTPSNDDAETDFDCDTNQLLARWGGGSLTLEDLAIRHWGAFAIDGQTHSVNLFELKGVTWAYGNGKAVGDFGGNVRFSDWEVTDSQFDSSVFGTFGAAIHWYQGRIRQSKFDQAIDLNPQNRWHVIEKLLIDSSEFLHAVRMTGGQYNRVSGVRVTGRAMADLDAAPIRITQADDLIGNVVEDVVEDGAGSVQNNDRCLVYIRNATLAQTEGEMWGNVFRQLRLHDRVATGDVCLVCLFDDPNSECTGAGAPEACCTGSGAGTCEERLLDDNWFGESLVASDAGTARGFCTGGTGSTAAIAGSGGGGTDPRGCGVMTRTGSTLTVATTTCN